MSSVFGPSSRLLDLPDVGHLTSGAERADPDPVRARQAKPKLPGSSPSLHKTPPITQKTEIPSYPPYSEAQHDGRTKVCSGGGTAFLTINTEKTKFATFLDRILKQELGL